MGSPTLVGATAVSEIVHTLPLRRTLPGTVATWPTHTPPRERLYKNGRQQPRQAPKQAALPHAWHREEGGQQALKQGALTQGTLQGVWALEDRAGLWPWSPSFYPGKGSTAHPRTALSGQTRHSR